VKVSNAILDGEICCLAERFDYEKHPLQVDIYDSCAMQLSVQKMPVILAKSGSV